MNRKDKVERERKYIAMPPSKSLEQLSWSICRKNDNLGIAIGTGKSASSIIEALKATGGTLQAR